MSEAEPREIDWANAEVRDGTLSVALSGASSKAWSSRFQGVLRLLAPSNAGWGEIVLQKRALEAGDVQGGAEEDLRHFLESVVLQVNADLVGETDPGATKAAQPEQDPNAAAEAEMSEKFRSFAESPETDTD